MLSFVFKSITTTKLLAVIFVMFSFNVNSQEYLDTVIDRINSIETELKDLRGTKKNGVVVKSNNFNDIIASHEQRLVSIEEDIRSLNGYLDDISYKLEQLLENIKQSESDNIISKNNQNANLLIQDSKNIAKDNLSEENQTIIIEDPNIKLNPGMKILGVVDNEKLDNKEKELKETQLQSLKPENIEASQINKDELEKLSKNPSNMYKHAYEMLVLENYTDAENAFKVFIGEHPKDSLTSNAYYWLGETYYVQKKFQLAAVSFARGYQKFPKGNKALDQLFKLSLTFMNMGKYEDACASFSKLEVEFPKAPERISNRAKEYKKRAKC